MARTPRSKFIPGKKGATDDPATAIVVADAEMRETASAITRETLDQLLRGLKERENTRDLGRLCVVLKTMVPYVGKIGSAATKADEQTGEAPTFADFKAAILALPANERRELTAALMDGAMPDAPAPALPEWVPADPDDPEVGGPHPTTFEDL